MKKLLTTLALTLALALPSHAGFLSSAPVLGDRHSPEFLCTTAAEIVSINEAYEVSVRDGSRAVSNARFRGACVVATFPEGIIEEIMTTTWVHADGDIGYTLGLRYIEAPNSASESGLWYSMGYARAFDA